MLKCCNTRTSNKKPSFACVACGSTTTRKSMRPSPMPMPGFQRTCGFHWPISSAQGAVAVASISVLCTQTLLFNSVSCTTPRDTCRLEDLRTTESPEFQQLLSRVFIQMCTKHRHHTIWKLLLIASPAKVSKTSFARLRIYHLVSLWCKGVLVCFVVT